MPLEIQTWVLFRQARTSSRVLSRGIVMLFSSISSVTAQAPCAYDSAGRSSVYQHVITDRETPLAAMRRAVSGHPVVLLGDVHPAAEPKRLLLALLEDSVVSEALDVLVLEIPTSSQRWVNAYLASSPEDISLLERDGAVLRAIWGGRDEWLAIFHQLWILQRSRKRSLEVIAGDLPGWPAGARTQRIAMSMYADRDSALASAVQSRPAGTRALVFVGGYHVLRGLEADVSIGSNSGRVIWLATRLQRAGVDVFTVLSDGLPACVILNGQLVGGATRVFDVLSNPAWPAAPYAIRVDSTFDSILKPVREPADTSDIVFTLRPFEYHLRDAVDLFIYWGRTTSLDQRQP